LAIVLPKWFLGEGTAEVNSIGGARDGENLDLVRACCRSWACACSIGAGRRAGGIDQRDIQPANGRAERHCGLACGFTVLSTETVYVQALVFTDENGALVRYIAHVSFEGSLIKEATGESLPHRGVWTQTLDVADDTLTTDGLRQELIGSDGSPAAMQVGHLVLPASGSLTAIDESTRADFFDWFGNVCPAFS
jgi:hypothetical protein